MITHWVATHSDFLTVWNWVQSTLSMLSFVAIIAASGRYLKWW